MPRARFSAKDITLLEERKMSRTAWSNLFVGLAAVNLALAFLPQNPLRMLDWIAFPACIALGAAARRRMA